MLLVLTRDNTISDLARFDRKIKGPDLGPQPVEPRVRLAHGTCRLRDHHIVCQPESIAIESDLPFAHETEIVDPNGVRQARILEHPRCRL